MARGRIPLNPTKFLNSKRRVISMTANGKYAVRTAKGGLAYNPKAKFVKSPGGSERSLANSRALVPTPIRPKMVRKVRANRGKARGAYAGVKAGALVAMFSPKPKRGRGRPRKHMVSPGGNLGIAALFGGKPVRKPRARKMLYKVKFGGKYIA